MSLASARANPSTHARAKATQRTLMLGLLGVTGFASAVFAYRASTTGAKCCAQPPSRLSLSGWPAAVPVSVESTAATSLPEDMVFIPGGTFWMGSDDPRMPDARPWHEVAVDPFWMDRTEVTNEQF